MWNLIGLKIEKTSRNINSAGNCAPEFSNPIWNYYGHDISCRIHLYVNIRLRKI